MELELGLKIIKTGKNLTSTDFKITKDRAGPLFFSRETENMFVLTAHLKGFRRDRIKIDISEDGTRIAISGSKPVQEMVLMNWIMYKKEVEIQGFRKVFRIPDGVVLDRIKAKFNEEDTILSIFMPKSIKGIQGIGIEELREEEVDGESSEKFPVEVPEKDLAQEALQPESKQQEIMKVNDSDPVRGTTSETPEIKSEKETIKIIPTDSVEFPTTTIPDQDKQILESMEVEPDRELNQSNTPDSLPFKEIRDERPLEIPEQIKKQDVPEVETKTPEQESQGRDYSPESVEPTEVEPDQVLHQLNMPDEHPTQEIREESTGEETKKPEQESQKHEELVTNTSDQCLEAVEPDQGLQSPKTPDADNLQDQQIVDHKGQIEEEIREVETKAGEEIEEGGIEEEPDIGFSEIEKAAEEESKRNESDRSIQTPSRKSRFCVPFLFAGTTLLGFLIILVMQLVKTNKKTKNN